MYNILIVRRLAQFCNWPFCDMPAVCSMSAIEGILLQNSH